MDSRAARIASLRIPFEQLPRIGGMATMPTREKTLRAALPNVLAQLERLYLYLDKHTEVPGWLAAMPKVTCILPTADAPSLGTAGKLRGMQLYGEPCLYFCFDDDIRYGDGYVQLLAATVRRYGYHAIAGLLGRTFPLAPASYLRTCKAIHFAKGQEFDVLVDELGTGTIGFHSSAIHLEPERWAEPNMCDLQLMIDAVRQEVPRICVKRPPMLAAPLAEDQPDSLYREAKRDDGVQSALLRKAMRYYPGRWCSSP